MTIKAGLKTENKEPMYALASMTAKDVGVALQTITRPFAILTRLDGVRVLVLNTYDANGNSVGTRTITTKNLSEVTAGKVSNPDVLVALAKMHNLDVGETTK
jgi:methyl coenzyme M reductase subunit C-like uncharacterized protein (methanogenesis marker protein 7)